MRLVLRFTLLAVAVGAALGVVLRATLGSASKGNPHRSPFVLLARLALLPVAAHAIYLTWVLVKNGAEAWVPLAFSGAVLLLLLVALLTARRLLMASRVSLALVPITVAVIYTLVALAFSYVALRPLGVVPSTVPAAALALSEIALLTALLLFVPEAKGGSLLRFRRERP